MFRVDPVVLKSGGKPAALQRVPAPSVDSFIHRWAASGAAERANYQLFLSELCALLDVPPPDPTRPDDADNAYVFERNVHFQDDDGGTSIDELLQALATLGQARRTRGRKYAS